MRVPLTVTFEELPVHEGMRGACSAEVENLGQYCDGITSCAVTVSPPHGRHRAGRPFDVHVRLAVPGGEIVVSHAPAEHRGGAQAGLAITETFDEVRRQLMDYVQRRRDRQKHGPAGVPPMPGEPCAPGGGDGFLGVPAAERLFRHDHEPTKARPPDDSEPPADAP